MFSRKTKNTIDSLIGVSTTIDGDLHFKGGLRIDGHIKGNVVAEAGQPSMLVVSEHAKIEGEVRVAHLVINGEVVGAVYSTELLELQPKARIIGDVHDMIGDRPDGDGRPSELLGDMGCGRGNFYSGDLPSAPVRREQE